MGDTKRLQDLRAELHERRSDLADLRAALPRHSVRPHQMIEIEDMEELIRDLEDEIARLEEQTTGSA